MIERLRGSFGSLWESPWDAQGTPGDPWGVPEASTGGSPEDLRVSHRVPQGVPGGPQEVPGAQGMSQASFLVMGPFRRSIGLFVVQPQNVKKHEISKNHTKALTAGSKPICWHPELSFVGPKSKYPGGSLGDPCGILNTKRSR